MLPVWSWGQNPSIDYKEQRSISIRYTQVPPIIDGFPGDTAWDLAPESAPFFASYPIDSGWAQYPTQVKLLFDDDYLYVRIICRKSPGQKYLIQSLKRDFNFRSNDAFVLILDPYAERQNAWVFGISSQGVQMDGQKQNASSGGEGLDLNWNAKWYSEVSRNEEGWTAELAIPFSSLRYDPKRTLWGINFIRTNPIAPENSLWMHVGKQYFATDLTYLGTAVFERPPPQKSGGIAIIPYVTSGIQDPGPGAGELNLELDGGLDAKVAVNNSLNLDITLNPDFSQVEVDRQVTDLSRFSLFFPEKRNFFLENSDMFNGLGIPPMRPFFSRRIGLHQGQEVPIIAGARLSGKLDQDWRIGVLTVQTDADTALGLSSRNYGALVLERSVLKRSRIAGFLINRQSFATKEGKLGSMDNAYNRVGGVEFNFRSANNVWGSQSFIYHSFNPHLRSQNQNWVVNGEYKGRSLSFMHVTERIQDNFLADVGFTPNLYHYDQVKDSIFRHGYYKLFELGSYKFYPQRGLFSFHGPVVSVENYFDGQYNLMEHNLELRYQFLTRNFAHGWISYFRDWLNLLHPIDVTGTQGVPLASGIYEWQYFGFSYEGTRKHALFGDAWSSIGEFYKGSRFSLGGLIGLRRQPWGIFSVSAERNIITMPAPYSSADLWLIGPKLELSFSRELFLTTFVQYNTQANNLNINSRFQWRFAPLSDFYLVYTDNYFPDTFQPKGRALVAKISYWINT